MNYFRLPSNGRILNYLFLGGGLHGKDSQLLWRVARKGRIINYFDDLVRIAHANDKRLIE